MHSMHSLRAIGRFWSDSRTAAPKAHCDRRTRWAWSLVEAFGLVGTVAVFMTGFTKITGLMLLDLNGNNYSVGMLRRRM